MQADARLSSGSFKSADQKGGYAKAQANEAGVSKRSCLTTGGRSGLEPRTRWLIPPAAGLCQLAHQKSSDSAFFDLSLKDDRFTFVCALLCPYSFPWSRKNLCSSSTSVFRIVMLVYATLNVVTVTAIISTGGLALDYVYPVWHGILSKEKGPIF